MDKIVHELDGGKVHWIYKGNDELDKKRSIGDLSGRER